MPSIGEPRLFTAFWLRVALITCCPAAILLPFYLRRARRPNPPLVIVDDNRIPKQAAVSPEPAAVIAKSEPVPHASTAKERRGDTMDIMFLLIMATVVAIVLYLNHKSLTLGH